MSNDLVETTNQNLPMSPELVKNQVNQIQEIMSSVMKKDEHFGKIPGCGDKMVLFKSGAEKLNLTFRLLPKYEIVMRDLDGGHREYEIITSLYNPNGQFMGQGVGMCSTMESKYRYRNGERICPTCGKAAIIKGKAEYGGGWVCFKRKDGCGEKFPDGAKEIETQVTGKNENPDIADTYNTVEKMAKKRSYVDCTITVTAASDIFAQDIEDIDDNQNASNGKNPPDEQTKKDNETRDETDVRHRLEIKAGLKLLSGIKKGDGANDVQFKMMGDLLYEFSTYKLPDDSIYPGVRTTVDMSGLPLTIVTGKVRKAIKDMEPPKEVTEGSEPESTENVNENNDEGAEHNQPPVEEVANKSNTEVPDEALPE